MWTHILLDSCVYPLQLLEANFEREQYLDEASRCLAQDVAGCQRGDQQQHKSNDILTVVVVVVLLLLLLRETREDQCVYSSYWIITLKNQ